MTCLAIFNNYNIPIEWALKNKVTARHVSPIFNPNRGRDRWISELKDSLVYIRSRRARLHRDPVSMPLTPHIQKIFFLQISLIWLNRHNFTDYFLNGISQMDLKYRPQGITWPQRKIVSAVDRFSNAKANIKIAQKLYFPRKLLWPVRSSRKPREPLSRWHLAHI